MPHFPTRLVAMAGLLLSGCTQGPEESQHDANASAGDTKPAPTIIAEAIMSDAVGQELGKIQIVETDGELSLAGVIEGEMDGEHAFHLHDIGACDPPEFKSAGGHLNPFGRTHGKLSEGGAHLGDLPNLVLTNGRTAEISVPLEGSA
ncbi:MAG: superoxide dismutase family protein, partial [Pseudomonadota bacterium]